MAQKLQPSQIGSYTCAPPTDTGPLAYPPAPVPVGGFTDAVVGGRRASLSGDQFTNAFAPYR